MLGMQLDHGGHLTHGASVNFSGKLYNFVPYGLNKDTETIDYDAVERQAKEHKPKLIVAGCSAYPRILDFPRFRAIADSVGALLMVDMAHISGLIAGGAHPSPLPYANIVTSTTQKSLRGPRGGFILCDKELARKVDFAVFPFSQGGPLMQAIAGKAVCFGKALKPEFSIYAHQLVSNCKTLASDVSDAGIRLVSGGTENDMGLVDVTRLGISGQQAERALEDVGIITNKNAIPFDPRPPRVTSGLRLGTPAITSRGMKEPEVKRIAAMLIKVLSDLEDKEAHINVAVEVKSLTSQFSVPGIDN